MTAINFDQPSEGRSSSVKPTLLLQNHGNGAGLHAETGAGNHAAIESIQLINDPTLGVAAFYAESNGGGPAVLANATNAGPGVHANSKQAAGVRAHTSSRNAAAIECIHDVTDPTLGVAAFYAESNGGGPAVLANATNAGPGVHANSKQAAGVRAQTGSDNNAAIEGIGKVAGRFVGDVEVSGDIRLIGADCAEEFVSSPTEIIEPGTVMGTKSSR